jgi:hypothetical protein
MSSYAEIVSDETPQISFPVRTILPRAMSQMWFEYPRWTGIGGVLS